MLPDGTFRGRKGESQGPQLHSVIPGLLPGTQSWPLCGSRSRAGLSRTRPGKSYGAMGGTRLSRFRTAHRPPFRPLPRCSVLRDASLTTGRQTAPPALSPPPCFSLLCVSSCHPVRSVFVSALSGSLHTVVSPVRRTSPNSFTESPAPRRGLA